MSIKVNIHTAKTHLSRYLSKLKEGDTIVLCNRNTPVAEIRSLKKRRLKKRPIGLDKGKIKIPASFFEPLPEDILSAFEVKH